MLFGDDFLLKISVLTFARAVVAYHPWHDPAKMAHPGGGQSSRLGWLERGVVRLTRVSHRGGTPPPGFPAASIWPVVNGSLGR